MKMYYLFKYVKATVALFLPPAPKKKKTKSKGHRICSKSLSCLEEVRIQTQVLSPRAELHQLQPIHSFIHSTQIYLFRTY